MNTDVRFEDGKKRPEGGMKMRYIPKRTARNTWHVIDTETNVPVYDDEGGRPLVFDHDCAKEFASSKNCDEAHGICGTCNGTGFVRHPRYGKPSCPSDEPVPCPDCSQ
jgi:hypothetical protein